MAEDIRRVLEEATKDLLYQSESDEPFEVVQWNIPQEDLAITDVLRLSGHAESEPVKVTSFESFFEPLLKDKDWHGSDEKADVEKYRSLVKAMNRHLADIQVFRIGSIQVHIYIVGKAKGGNWAGIKTVAVET